MEKLSEMDKKLEKLSVMQDTSKLNDEQAVVKPDFNEVKEEIITEIKEQVGMLHYFLFVT